MMIKINGKEISDNSREYYATRKPYLPEVGEVLENCGGFKVRVLPSFAGGWREGRAWAEVINIKSGWRCIARGIGMYADGRIDWDSSEGLGFFDPEDKF